VWRAEREIPEELWRKAKNMGAEVAECDYIPGGWPEHTRCVVRRVRVERDELRKDKRSRRRRTIDPNQLRLLEDGGAELAYAYSFIVTNLDWDVVEVEAWFRQRALVEEAIKDSKAGMALRHLPSGHEAVNRTWMWAAFLAFNCSAWLQSLAGVDIGPDGRAHGKRLRRELISVRHGCATTRMGCSCVSLPNTDRASLLTLGELSAHSRASPAPDRPVSTGHRALAGSSNDSNCGNRDLARPYAGDDRANGPCHALSVHR